MTWNIIFFGLFAATVAYIIWDKKRYKEKNNEIADEKIKQKIETYTYLISICQQRGQPKDLEAIKELQALILLNKNLPNYKG